MDEALPDEEKIIADAVKLGDEAKERLASDPEAVRKVLAGRVDVEDWVTVYPDKAANLRFAKVQEELQKISREIPTQDAEESDKDYADRTAEFRERLEAIEAESNEAREAVKASGLTFHFVGLGKKAIKRIRADVRKEYPLPPAGEQDDPDIAELRDEEYQNRVIAAHLIASGYTKEDVEAWRDAWPNRAFGKLWATAMKLSITDDYLNGAIDVDF
jgi:hypothetical protein